MIKYKDDTPLLSPNNMQFTIYQLATGRRRRFKY